VADQLGPVEVTRRLAAGDEQPLSSQGRKYSGTRDDTVPVVRRSPPCGR
jgi:hypothetical protein